jgi:hypothetical protein
MLGPDSADAVARLDSGASLTQGRRGSRDDRRAPLVSRSGAGERAVLAGVGRGPTGPRKELGCYTGCWAATSWLAAGLGNG